MPVEANGWLTGDGHFFEHKADAEFHEAEIALQMKCGTYGIPWHALEQTLSAFATQIRRYLDAQEAINRHRQPDTDRAPVGRDEDAGDFIARELAALVGEHSTDDEAAEDRTYAVLEQSVGGMQSVSPVRSGERSEAIRHDSQSDGVGGRAGDASSVRSRPSVAAESDPEVTETLESRR